jgi:hypothetical protein
MSIVLNKARWGEFEIRKTELLYRQRWLCYFLPLGQWSANEKSYFKQTAINQIKLTWDDRVTFQATPRPKKKTESVSKTQKTLPWRIEITTGSQMPHWDIYVHKLPAGQKLQTPDGPADAYVWNLKGTVNVSYSAFLKDLDKTQGAPMMAHEFVHMLGLANPDEYKGGPNFSDSNSIANRGEEVRPRHLSPILEVYNSMVSDVIFSFGSWQ